VCSLLHPHKDSCFSCPSGCYLFSHRCRCAPFSTPLKASRSSCPTGCYLFSHRRRCVPFSTPLKASCSSGPSGCYLFSHRCRCVPFSTPSRPHALPVLRVLPVLSQVQVCSLLHPPQGLMPLLSLWVLPVLS
ncbi:hypothetical protein NDU88_013321, partial [Pleurodeles waltl]